MIKINAQGTSGIWKYRKWNSGFAECYGDKTATSSSVTSGAVSGYYCHISGSAAPPFTFVTTSKAVTVSAFATSDDILGWVYGFDYTNGQFTSLFKSSSKISIKMHVILQGYYK